jgi:surface polysaccharide O-acyltransferase-like enzyme
VIFASPAGGLWQPHNQAHRVLACCTIIVGHCEEILGIDSSLPGRIFQLTLNVWGQYAVPLFFVLAGYSLAPKLSRPGSQKNALKYTRRIFAMFLSASAFYFLLNAASGARPGQSIGRALRQEAERVLRAPEVFILGTAPHLWFLVALILAVWTTTYVRSQTRLRYLFGVGAICYILLMATGPYSMFTGWHSLPSVWRMTLFSGTPFLAVGLALRHASTLPPTPIAFLVIAAGLLCQVAEQYWRWTEWGLTPFRVGPLLGTGLHAIGMSLLAVRPGTSWFSQQVARLGPLTLFTYLIHMAFVAILVPRMSMLSRPTARWLFPVVVAILSFGCAAVYYWSMMLVWRNVRRLK